MCGISMGPTAVCTGKAVRKYSIPLSPLFETYTIFMTQNRSASWQNQLQLIERALSPLEGEKTSVAGLQKLVPHDTVYVQTTEGALSPVTQALKW